MTITYAMTASLLIACLTLMLIDVSRKLRAEGTEQHDYRHGLRLPERLLCGSGER